MTTDGLLCLRNDRVTVSPFKNQSIRKEGFSFLVVCNLKG